MRNRLKQLGTMLAAICCLGAPGWAQDSALDYLEPRIDRTQFQALTRPLNLDSNQRMIVEMLYSEYNDAVSDLAQRLDQQANDAGRQTIQAALSGALRVGAEELRTLRVDVLNVYQQGWPELDKAMDDLIHGVEAVLTPEQAAMFDAAELNLRRNTLLHPRQASSGYQEYAGDGVDVLLLLHEAMAADGELAQLDPQSMQAIKGQYEQQVDAMLLQTWKEHRAGKMRRRIAEIQKDTSAIRQQEQAALKRWQQLYELNKSTVERIGEIAAASLGEEARQLWLDRFDQASFTWLYPRRRPDRQIEWIRERRGLAGETLEKAEHIYVDYLSKRKALSRQAIDLMLRGRLELQAMIYSMMDPALVDDRARRTLYEDLLKNSGELASLESTASSALEALLSSADRDALRDAMKRPDTAPTSRRRR